MAVETPAVALDAASDTTSLRQRGRNVANIIGNNQANTLVGTAAADTIEGRGGADAIDGGDGDDYIDGGNANDILFGGRGNDRLIGGDGNDELNGGEGNDILEGGSGTDWASFENGAAVNADLTTGLATGQGNDTITGIENLRGSSNNDTLKGNSGNNTLQGGAGADLLIATAGSDVLNGGADIDTASFSIFTSSVNASLASGSYSSAFGSGQLSAIENLTGSALNDILTGNAQANTINGGLGSDTLNGAGGVDTLSYADVQSHNFIDLSTGVVTQQWNGLSVGTDSVSNFENVTGGDNYDQIRGNAGNNVINGGGASDLLLASMGIDHLDGGTGANDTVEFSGVGAVTASLASNTYSINATNYGTMANIDHLTGGSSGDTLTGDGARNYLSGGAGNDLLTGGGGNDELWGGAGSDRLVADGGDDLLVGNYDRLNGMGDYASDIFEIRTNAGSVTIADFQVGVDKIDLTAFGFDQNGVSAYWTGSVTANNVDTILTLTGLNNEVVTLRMQGVAQGEGLAISDFIGGSSSLIPTSQYPMNGGDGLHTVTTLTTSSASQTIHGFENGLDQLDISQLIQNGWDGYLSNTQEGWVVVNFEDGQGGAFAVTLEGVTIAQIDASDYIL